MKLVPPLAPLNAPTPNMERLSLMNPSIAQLVERWTVDDNYPSDLLWRYPAINFHPYSPSYLPADFKTHLPANLGGDPRLWSREDVVSFLRWAQYEFDLPAFDLDMFQMNGKALCFLTKADLGERSPGNGDVLHNVLQMLIRDSRTLPSSPLTPQFPLTPSWSFTSAHAIDFPSTPPAVTLNSVTLSPAPSVDSQAGSPRHLDQTGSYPALNNYNGSSSGQNGCASGSGSHSSSSNQSDSEVDNSPRPPVTPTLIPRTPPPHSPASTKNMGPSAFFPSEPVSEPNTNGRLLWDFLQQLLNDSHQRYTAYIAWKNREHGVFKIVDPPGLAKLWGIQKNHLSMNYDKMSRALRYYYRVNILRKVQGERHCYQFLRNPSELKSIKNISLLRQQMSSSAAEQQQQPPAICVKSEPADPADDDLKPTDLSMGQHFRVFADFEHLRNPSELKIMKNLHTLREQRANSTAAASASSESQPHSHLHPQPRDLSVGNAMQLSLNLAAEQMNSRRQGLHTLKDQRANSAASASTSSEMQPHSHLQPQPRDLSVDSAMQLSLNLAAEHMNSRPQDLHTLREQRANSTAAASMSSEAQPPSQLLPQPRDLSVGSAMQLSLNLAAEQLSSRPQDLSVSPHHPLPLIKTEDCDRS